jgi:hypothetical protein
VRKEIKVSLGCIRRPWLKKKKRAKQKQQTSQELVAHTYNPSYSGGREQEDQVSKPTRGKQLKRPYLKNIQHKKGLADWLKQ